MGLGEPLAGVLGGLPGVVLGKALGGLSGEGLDELSVEVLGDVPGVGLGVHLGGVLVKLLVEVLDERVAAVGPGLVPGSWLLGLGEPLGETLGRLPCEGLDEHPVVVLGEVPGEDLEVHLGGVLVELLSGVLVERVAADGHCLVPGSSRRVLET